MESLIPRCAGLDVQQGVGRGRRTADRIGRNMLKHDTTYAELGGNFLDRLEPERMTRYYVKRLQALGHRVTLDSSVAA